MNKDEDCHCRIKPDGKHAEVNDGQGDHGEAENN